MPKRAAESGASPPAKRAASALALCARFDGESVAVELAPGAQRTSQEVCAAVAKAVDLPAVLLSITHDDNELSDETVAGLKAGAEVDVEVKEAAGLAMWAFKAERAAKAAGRGEEFVLEEGADDEAIESVTDSISLPPQVEMLLRFANGVKASRSVKSWGSAVTSTSDIMEIYNYNPVLQEAFDGVKGCVPWVSVDCEFAFQVLASNGNLWEFDHECKSDRCLGTLEARLKAIHGHFAGKAPAKELEPPKSKSGARRPPLRYRDVYGADDFSSEGDEEGEEEDADDF